MFLIFYYEVIFIYNLDYNVMSVKEIFESEKRNNNDIYDIHFYMEGSFWRAYEWSAYLSRNFPSKLMEGERLKPLKKFTKDYENGYVQVGLQLSSFDKYFPNVVDNDEVFEMLNKHIVIHAKSFFIDSNFSDYEKILIEWKNNIKASDKEKKKRKEITIEHYSNNNISADSLINETISYPIESKNLVESLQFLSYIKDKAIKINKES